MSNLAELSTRERERMIKLLRCAHCGRQIFDQDGQGSSFMREPIRPGAPMFCSQKCADDYNPQKLTEGLVSSMIAFFPTASS